MGRLWLLLCVFVSPALAADVQHYHNPRFGYDIVIPQYFSISSQSDNGDGLALTARDGTELRIYGHYPTDPDGNFASEFRNGIASWKRDGWAITYVKSGLKLGSYSGTRKDHIVYVRTIALCDGASADFVLDYLASAKKQYDPVISQLVKTFKQSQCEQ